jgi:drug/metabolite transporter (DMT)-like permease
MIPLTWESWSKVDWSGLGVSHYSAILYNVLLCTVVAFVVWNASMYKIGAMRANFFRYVVPAAAVVVGLLFFDEGMTFWQMIGAISMAAGLVWISTERKPRPAVIISPIK